jgi:hypothetical protein
MQYTKQEPRLLPGDGRPEGLHYFGGGWPEGLHYIWRSRSAGL